MNKVTFGVRRVEGSWWWTGRYFVSTQNELVQFVLQYFENSITILESEGMAILSAVGQDVES